MPALAKRRGRRRRRRCLRRGARGRQLPHSRWSSRSGAVLGGGSVSATGWPFSAPTEASDDVTTSGAVGCSGAVSSGTGAWPMLAGRSRLQASVTGDPARRRAGEPHLSRTCRREGYPHSLQVSALGAAVEASRAVTSSSSSWSRSFRPAKKRCCSLIGLLRHSTGISVVGISPHFCASPLRVQPLLPAAPRAGSTTARNGRQVWLRFGELVDRFVRQLPVQAPVGADQVGDV